MFKSSSILLPLLLTISLYAKPCRCNKLETHELTKWAENLETMKQKATHLHFYFHDMTGGRRPTAMTVAQSSTSNKTPTYFGKINMMDDPLTEGPEKNSKQVGRARGMYAFIAQDELTLLLATSFHFTHGKHNGSSISMLSYNPALHPQRELAIVGGTGKFRLARGVALAKNIYSNFTSGEATIEYDFMVLHYED